MTIYKVIPGETGSDDPVGFFDKYVDYDAPYPAWDLLLTVAERDNYPIVGSGVVSSKKPLQLELKPGYYIIAPTTKKQYGPKFDPWWVVWGPSSNPSMTRWEAFKTFWGGEKITQIHRFRAVKSYDRDQWCRLMHVNKTESFNYRPFRNLKFQDWEKVPPSWDEKIAQWAEKKAEQLYTTLKSFFT